MKILLVGSGGREHALAWMLAQSQKCSALYCAPGNAGIATIAECVDIAADDVEALVDFSRKSAIDFVVVGPEAPLVAGLADKLNVAGIKVFGPSAAAARLEGSKAFMKDLCKKYNIPTAAYGRFKDIEKAKAFIAKQTPPVVVKADGLAAGKGVIIAQSHEEAIAAAQDMLSGSSFGAAGAEIVVEEFLDGEELSYFALSDGKTLLPLTSAQDHKRVGEGDTGPNTGGMGAYSPAHLMTPEMEKKIISRLIVPTIEGMAKEGCSFTGVLFAGIMVVKGEPVLLEYNARFGDPECQAIMLRLKSDLLDILLAAAEGRLGDVKAEWSDMTAMCVVMAAKGYPGAYAKNTVIEGVNEAGRVDNTMVFHAGTTKGDKGQLLSTGGRVLGITSTGENIGHARRLAYEAVDQIKWPEGFCRRDIGWRALEKKDNAA